MHAEYIGLSREERTKILNDLVFDMVKEMCKMTGLDHKASVLQVAYGDELETEKEKDGSQKTYTFSGFSEFNIVDAKKEQLDADGIAKKFKNVDAKDLSGIARQLGITTKLFETLIKKRQNGEIKELLEGAPEELKGLLKGLEEVLRSAAEGAKGGTKGKKRTSAYSWSKEEGLQDSDREDEDNDEGNGKSFLDSLKDL